MGVGLLSREASGKAGGFQSELGFEVLPTRAVFDSVGILLGFGSWCGLWGIWALT